MTGLHHDTDRRSVVITRRVRSGCEAAYEALLHGLLEDTKRFSGFQGGQVLRPKSPHLLEYQVTLHFENREAKERWARSEERRRWVDGMKALADTGDYDTDGARGLVHATGWGPHQDGTQVQDSTRRRGGHFPNGPRVLGPFVSPTS